ncbi:hypothetical protein ACQV2T_06730 [Facklamia sp. P13069]|uniref:hypothetical protein n=1 Tax=Facklamia sp. P13069 TaxID=3421954 RepID=UPI003D17E0D4
MLKKKDIIQPVYNAGKITFYSVSPKKDKFGTIIRGEYQEEKVSSHWFRHLGITASDTYYAHADDVDISRKLAVRGKTNISTKYIAKIGDKIYEVYRYFYAYKNNETEISLKEVD